MDSASLQIKVQLRDFRAAKRCLKKAHGLSARDDRDDVMKQLHQVCRLERLYARVQQAADDRQRLAALEKFADTAAGYLMYYVALVAYSETVRGTCIY